MRIRLCAFGWAAGWPAALASLLLVLAMVSVQADAAPATVAAPATWRAQWIAAPNEPPQDPGVYHFRKDFDLAVAPGRFLVRVSADNRYRQYVNGMEVSNGPARGDLLHWRYETADLGPHLRTGRNVLAALVWNFGEHKPAAQVSLRTAFLLEGEGAEGAIVDTGPSWKVLANKGYSFSPVVGPDGGGYYVAGPHETLDAAAYSWGWEGPGFDASGWASAQPLGAAEARGTNRVGLAIAWQLVPRAIPLPEQRPVRFAEVRRGHRDTSQPSIPAGHRRPADPRQ